MHGLVFPHINITKKPQVTHRVTSWSFLIREIDIGSIQYCKYYWVMEQNLKTTKRYVT